MPGPWYDSPPACRIVMCLAAGSFGIASGTGWLSVNAVPFASPLLDPRSLQRRQRLTWPPIGDILLREVVELAVTLRASGIAARLRVRVPVDARQPMSPIRPRLPSESRFSCRPYGNCGSVSGSSSILTLRRRPALLSRADVAMYSAVGEKTAVWRQ